MSQNNLKQAWNEQKWSETSQNAPLPPKKNCKTTQNNFKIQNWVNLEIFTSFHFSNFQPKCPNLGSILGQKSSTLQSFNEILPVPYFEGADFKSDISFWKF